MKTAIIIAVSFAAGAATKDLIVRFVRKAFHALSDWADGL
jgi:hypothetical protein